MTWPSYNKSSHSKIYLKLWTFKICIYLLNQIIAGDVKKVENEIKRTFIETYKKTDDEFLKEATKQWEFF